MLASDQAGAEEVQEAGWIPWLQVGPRRGGRAGGWVGRNVGWLGGRSSACCALPSSGDSVSPTTPTSNFQTLVTRTTQTQPHLCVLQDLAVSQDLKLSSCASRALLHIESAAATQRPGLSKLALPLHCVPAPLLPVEQPSAAAGVGDLEQLLGSPSRHLGGGGSSNGGSSSSPSRAAEAVVAEAAEMLGEARHALAQVR